jgi:hypothetical protein
MPLDGLMVYRPPSSSDARKLKCFLKSVIVILAVASEEGRGRFPAVVIVSAPVNNTVSAQMRKVRFIETP